MYCKNCGAVVYGRFCSCCGKRVLTELKEFRKAERKAKKKFCEICCKEGDEYKLHLMHLADACWEVYSTHPSFNCVVWDGRRDGEYVVTPNAYENLRNIEQKAAALFEELLKAHKEAGY